MADHPFIELDNVCCGYPGGFSVSQVSLSAEKGQVCGLIGPNGSGKTTVLRAAAGSMRLSSGEVRIHGSGLHKTGRRELARILAVVSQDTASPFEMKVLEYVLLGRIPHRKGVALATSADDLSTASKMLETTGASELAERFLSELSGGERQLVHVARALAQEPSALFLDEPTNHLDLAHQHQIMKLIRKLSREDGLAVIVVLHDLNLAARFCDRLFLMHKGTLHSSGAPEEVLKPEILEKVYATRIMTCPDPVDGKPLIFTPC